MPSKYIETRTSPIHGRGVFAVRPIRKGTRLIEYQGARKQWADFEDDGDNYAFLFDVGKGRVIDPFDNGNDARFINHSCRPNCEAVLSRGRIFIEAIQDISPEEEITYDYSLTLDREPTPPETKRHPCRCGSRGCRKTLFAPFSD